MDFLSHYGANILWLMVDRKQPYLWSQHYAIFYGYGLACYRRLGVTYAVLVGAAMVICQYCFARYWFSNHSRGPLEGLWRKLTWLGRD